MAIEGVANAGTAYQGSGLEPAVKTAKAEPDKQTLESTRNLHAEEFPGTWEIKSQKQESDRNNTGETKEKKEAKEQADNKLPSPTEALRKAVEEINKKAVDSEAVFGVHDATNRVTIKIVNKDTREVIREYPPEKTLDMIAKVWELAGLLVDEKG